MDQIIEDKFPDLLKEFIAYINYQKIESDWRHPTFYNWCNSHFKKMSKSTVQQLPEQINDTETEKSFIDYDYF
ncbi:hypothetical protein [Candidatus Berkiella aquae]|uniref:Uncharacterized protein n=1 Tax=Candidatus Berkiella aquae TaxID=295108 RepID=A0AAE3HYA8_9GAMM|nr:hypothetical protein [Candidatus Berkiella aquae]MCS5712783.1 hypothetical protein [Candidatus Berkiella aquae]